MALYRYAPYVLGMFYALFGFSGFMLHMLGLNNTYLWVGAMVLLTASGFFLGGVLKKLKLDSSTDHLTQLWNRRYLQKKLDHEIVNSGKDNGSLWVVMLDIDNFKEINDTQGHSRGDRTLIEMTQILLTSVRSTDIIARWGGDEFVIVLPKTNQENATRILEYIRSKVELASPSHFTVSIGCAEVTSGMNAKQIFAVADKALYQAKKDKNTIVIKY